MRLAALFALWLALAGCAKERVAKVPGETDIQVAPPEFRAELDNGAVGGEELLNVSPAPLLPALGMRAGDFLFTDRYYSPFREAEDRRRLTAHWQSRGYFDVVVRPAKVDIDARGKTARVTWTIREGKRYEVRSVRVLHAPDEHRAAIEGELTFGAGETEIDLEAFRVVRHAMADHLRRRGFGHATVYSRTFVDRDAKRIDWVYYVDAGPRTRIGRVVVEGNRKVPSRVIQDRLGLRPGDPYDLEKRDKAEADLMDTGAFASVYVETNADVEFLIPGDAPDTGGALGDAQIDPEGNLVPRQLPDAIDLTVRVVESPSQQLRVGAGIEADPTRIDTSLGSEVWLRHLFGPQHHLTLEGRIGYGWLWRGETDDPTGLYGEALARSVHPGWIARLVDLRLTARYRDVLYPGFHLREVNLGPGFRSALLRGLFLEVDTYFRYGREVDFGPFDDATRAAFQLADDETSYGAELQVGIVKDARVTPTEPTRGHFLAAYASYAPGGPLGTHRWLSLTPEARGFVPFGTSWSGAARATASWVMLSGDDGVPLGPRLFGGGAYGMRGYGRHQLSPRAAACDPGESAALLECEGQPVGGLSLVEASTELRFLPPRKPYGGVAFVDFGGAGAEYNPFEDGLSLAFGLGFRLRLWYLPVSLDVAYRLLDRGDVERPVSIDPLLAFLRVGEAF